MKLNLSLVANKKIISIFIILLIISASYLVYYSQKNNPSGALKLKMVAEQTTAAGISVNSGFILGSNLNISTSEVKKMIKIDPSISFEVVRKKNTKATEIWTGYNNYYELKPSEVLAETAIYKIAAQAKELDHVYNWAFQTKAEFAVTQTHPGKNSNGVPLNSGLEIMFNRQKINQPNNFVNIEPVMSGDWEVQNDKIVFKPVSNWQANTIYTITIKKELSESNSNENLNKDYSFKFETSNAETTKSEPYFNWRQDYTIGLPEKNISLELDYGNFNLEEQNIEIYKLNNIEDFWTGYQSSRAWDLSWTSYYRNHQGSQFDLNKAQKITTFKPKIIKSEWRNFVEIPQKLEIGYYIVDLNLNNQHQQVWLQINPITYYYSLSYDKGLVWLYNFSQKTPLAQAKLSFIEANNTYELGQANNEGLVEFITPELLREGINDEYNNPKFLKISVANQEPLLVKVSDNWAGISKIQSTNDYWNYLSTDRYTYQLTDKLNYWGVIKGRQIDLKNKKVSISLYNGYGDYSSENNRPVASADVLVSAFDTISGELSFSGLTSGTYNVVAKLGNEIISSSTVEILSYNKPVYKITVASDKKQVYAGTKIKFDVKAEFFDGTPVSNLEAVYSAYWHQDVTGEIKLDKNGQGSFELLPEYLADKDEYYPQSLQVDVSPKLGEEGEILGRTNVMIFGPEMTLQAFLDNKELSNYTFRGKLNYIDIDKEGEYIGEIAPDKKLIAKIIRTKYSSKKVGEYYDPINKLMQPIYNYESSDSVFKELSGITNEKGEWIFTENLPYQTDSSYRVEISGTDKQSRNFNSIAYAYSFSDYNQKDFSINLNFDDEQVYKEYSVGDSINLKAKLNNQPTDFNNKILFYSYQTKLGTSKIQTDLNFSDEFVDTFKPSVSYRAVILGPNGFVESNDATASYRDTDSNLKIKIEADKKKYRPGDEASLMINVKDKDNQPVASQINLSIVDEALFNILPYNWQRDILPTLYQDVYTQLLTDAIRYDLNLNKMGAELGGCFLAGTQIKLANGSAKAIEDIKAGDELMTFESEASHVLKKAVVQGISNHEVTDYLIINNKLRVTPEHKIWLNNKWSYAGLAKLGDSLKNSKSEVELIVDIKKIVSPKTKVYNLNVNKYHTYLADDYYVHNAEKGGSVRSNLIDTAAYTTLSMDQSGQGIFKFTIPDNLTSWRVTALGYDAKSMKAGQEVAWLSTSLPLFIDAAISNQYLSGDEPVVHLRVFGDKYEANKEIEFSIKAPSLNFEKTIKTTNDNIYVVLPKLIKGNHKIIVGVKQGELQDALEKKLNVVDSYLQQATTKTYNVKPGLTGIIGSLDSRTKISFIDSGYGRYYGFLNGLANTSGLRLDQVSSGYLSSKLLNKYYKETLEIDALDLSAYQREDGGLSLFAYSDSDLELSALASSLLAEEVSQANLKKYFTNSLNNNITDIHRVSIALFGLASINESVLAQVQSLVSDKELSLADKIYIASALIKMGDEELAREIYQKDIATKLRRQNTEAWFDNADYDEAKNLKLSALAGGLANKLQQVDGELIWHYVAEHEAINNIASLEKIFLVKTGLSLSTEIKSSNLTISINNKNVDIKLGFGEVYNMNVSAEELAGLKIVNSTGDIDLISSFQENVESKKLSVDPNLIIKRQYLVNNKPVSDLKEGDVVLVRLLPEFKEKAMDGAYQIVDYLPSGLKPIMQLYREGLLTSNNDICNPIWYPTQIKNNTIYFNISKDFEKTNTCKNRTLNYYARVVSTGEFHAETAMLQSLKDTTLIGLSDSNIVKISHGK